MLVSFLSYTLLLLGRLSDISSLRARGPPTPVGHNRAVAYLESGHASGWLGCLPASQPNFREANFAEGNETVPVVQKKKEARKIWT